MIDLPSFTPLLSNPACLAESAAIFVGLLARTPRTGQSLRTVATADISTHIARTDEDLAEAQALVSVRYAGRGLATHEVTRSFADDALDPFRYVTLIAKDRYRTLGTLTLGIDAGAGLLADEMNRNILDEARREGRRLCEVVRLAASEGADTTKVLASLFSLGYLMARGLHQVTDAFVEVNPRHVPFYRRVLGFVCAAPPGTCARVKAPSVLLRLDLETLNRKMLSLGEHALDVALEGQ